MTTTANNSRQALNADPSDKGGLMPVLAAQFSGLTQNKLQLSMQGCVSGGLESL